MATDDYTEIAVVRRIGGRLDACELRYINRTLIDLDRARAQHQAYIDLLKRFALQVMVLDEVSDLPDSVFVEDTAVVLDELAVICQMGAVSRRSETEMVAERLREYRHLFAMNGTATLDGGDVLRIEQKTFVGRSTRTNSEGIEQFRNFVEPFGYTVASVDMSACLHLKTGCTYLGNETLLVNPDWVDAAAFAGMRLITVDYTEAFAANTLRLGTSLIMANGFPRTREKLTRAGFDVKVLDISELQKAEAGLTCLSLIFKD